MLSRPEISARETVDILAVGDVLIEEACFGKTARAVEAKGGSSFFSPVRSLFNSANIVLGNLENPISDRGNPIFKWGPNFRGSPRTARLLQEAGFTVLGLANNHIMDYGRLAFKDTLDSLQHVGIASVGAGIDILSSMSPAVIRMNGISVGFFAFTFRQESVASKRNPGAADLDDPRCFEVVRAYREKVDQIVVFLHMDPESVEYPAPHRIDTARKFVDAGARVVIGHHPHVRQGLEIYNGGLIAYSLGNFIFHTMPLPSAERGYMLRIKLASHVGIVNAEIIPYRINESYQPIPVFGEERREALQHIRLLSENLHDPRLVWLNWKGIAWIDTYNISMHIASAIIRRKPYWMWSGLLTLLKPRLRTVSQTLMQSLATRLHRSLTRNMRAGYARSMHGTCS